MKPSQCDLPVQQKNKVVSILKKKKRTDLKKHLPTGCVGFSGTNETLLYWNVQNKTILKIYSRNGIVTRYSTK